MNVSRLNAGAVLADLSYSSFGGLDESAFLMSDIHWDAVECDHDMLERHCEEAAERDAGIFIFGDLFDAMQGPKDPRAAKSALRASLEGKDAYFDEVVEQCAAWFGPYIPYLKVVGHGNHETVHIKHHGISLIDRFVDKVNMAGGDALSMGYEGWVLFRFERVSGDSTGDRFTQKLYFNHGSGGTSAVTKGVTKVVRRAAYLPDADIVCSGHIHESWQMDIPRMRVTNQGRWFEDEQLHLQLAAYLNGRDPSGMSWPASMEFSPKPKGAWRLDFSTRNGAPVRQATRLR